MIRRVLRLYPADYRAAYGGEIADIHEEMTAGMSRPARLRADADLAAHAVRIRLGLHSAAPAGRLVAAAAPFALGAGAVVHGLRLTSWYAGMVTSPAPVGLQLATLPLDYGLALLFSLLVCGGAIMALCGRWVPGVVVAVSGLLGSAALAACVFGELVVAPAVALTTVAVVLACPPDRRADRRLQTTAGIMAGCAWLPVVAVNTRAFGVSTEYGAWPLLVLSASGVVLALREGSRGLREAGAVALASPPMITYACTAWGDARPMLGGLLALALTGAVPAAFRTVRRPR
ncbi:hypothetical protein [Actinacidiphila glaucinigra]|uniref:hypothetical protein n=1 Tax=Actinacidiphila glaucinigra TaxID=235986 RepID=UPI0036726DCA